MQLIWSAASLRHLQHIFVYLATFNPQAAGHLIDALLAEGESLKHFAHRGRMVPDTDFRELTAVHPYIIRLQDHARTCVDCPCPSRGTAADENLTDRQAGL